MAGEKSVPNANALLGRLEALCRLLAKHADALPDLGGALADLSTAAEALAAADEEVREQALARDAALEQFRAIAENAPDVITRFDRAGRHLYVSPAAEAVTGLAPQEFLGKTCEDLGMPAALCAKWRRWIDRVFETGKPQDLEFEFPAAGGVRHFTGRAVPEFGPGGGVETVLTIARDQTRRRQREEEFRALVTNSPDYVTRLDTQGRLLYVNPAWAERQGMPAEEALARRLREVGFPDEAAGAWDRAFARLLMTGEEQTVEYRLKVRGRWRQYQTRLVPEFDPHDAVVSILAVGRDVTDLRQALARAEQAEAEAARARDGLEDEVAARTSELAEANIALQDEVAERRDAEAEVRAGAELLQRLFDVSHLLVAYLDTDFTFVRVNRTYAEADGHEPDFFPGKNHFDLYPDAENEAIFRRVLRTGKTYCVNEKPFVYGANPERGTTYWDWTLQPVFDDDGKVSGLLLTLLDVTERVRAREAREAERRRLFEVLNLLPGFVALVSPRDYTIRFANRRFIEALGEYRDRTCYEIVRGRSTPCDTCHCATVLETGEMAEWEVTVPSGRVFHVCSYPFAEEGEPPMVLELGVDVTEERRLRDEVVAASEAERRRMGQDLHDSLGQELTGLGFIAHSLARRLEAQDSPLVEDAMRLADIAHRASTQARGIARGLCPVDVHREGLMDALADLADHTGELFEVRCTLECPESVGIGNPDVATDLFYIAREAVNNAVKHARPKHIVIRLEETDGMLRLTVEDDGEGLPEALDPEAGMGLKVMRYRAHRIGGVLSAARRAEGGTAVTCALHLPDQPEPAPDAAEPDSVKRESHAQKDQ